MKQLSIDCNHFLTFPSEYDDYPSEEEEESEEADIDPDDASQWITGTYKVVMTDPIWLSTSSFLLIYS